ncbi:MAG: helicase-related protein, partial [Myxococcota bacterium]
HPESQLIILSATIGSPQQFCVWAYQVRRVKLELVQSFERRVPLEHQYREEYLVDTIKALYAAGDYPAIVFSFGRKLSFERARLLRSCPRFVDKEEQKEILQRAERVLLPTGLGPELVKLLQHGIGVHHAGVLPAYRRLVEELTADRLLKFIVTTETIAAGINLPAKRVIFPSLRKYIKKKARLLLPAEYHQMSGRAGRPQFDTEGIAITLAPEEVVQEFRKEIRDQKKKGFTVDEAKIKKKHYQRALNDARSRKDVTWDEEAFRKIVEGEPAALSSRTRITAEQILAVGLPDLEQEALPGEVLIEEEAARLAAAEAARQRALAEATGEAPAEPEAGEAVAAPDEDQPVKSSRPIAPAADAPYRRLNIRTVIDNLLLPEGMRHEAHKRLAMITANLQALGVLDSHGRQVDGFVVNKLRGVDGPFVWFFMNNLPEDHEDVTFVLRELVELVVDHDVVHNLFEKKEAEKRRQWILERLRERRRDNPQVSFEDVEEEYWEKFPPEPSAAERIHQAFIAPLPHQELHGGKRQKSIWAQMSDADQTFMDFVKEHDLAYEEGSLFTYLARLMKTARMLHEVFEEPFFSQMEKDIRHKLAAIDERVLEGLW